MKKIIPKIILALCFISVFAAVPASAVTITLTSGTTWNVPSDWNDSNNTIECVGGSGGGGGGNAAGVNGGGGGGGGAYSKIINQALTPSATVGISIGTAGSAGAANGNGTAGADTWLCNDTANCATIGGTAVKCGAKGGGAGLTNGTGGSGGSSGSGVGTLKNSGGNGASATPGSQIGGGGGGGGGSPNGGGANGGTPGFSGAGGGGSGGGTNGSNGGSGTPDVGGAGGNNSGGAGSGAGGPSTGTANGTAGTNGGGGGGGGRVTTGSTHVGDAGAGGAGTSDFSGTSLGSGGGGGGGGLGVNGGLNAAGKGGAGGLYGGGGGGGAGNAGDQDTGGAGTQGIIVINYTPATGAKNQGMIIGGRLSLDPNNAVMTQDTQSSVLYYVPFGIRSVAELSLTGMNGLYDVFGTDYSLCAVAWINNAPPINPCGSFLGVVNVVGGSSRCDLSRGYNRRCDVWNAKNQVPLVLSAGPPEAFPPCPAPCINGWHVNPADLAWRNYWNNPDISMTLLIGRKWERPVVEVLSLSQLYFAQSVAYTQVVHRTSMAIGDVIAPCVGFWGGMASDHVEPDIAWIGVSEHARCIPDFFQGTLKVSAIDQSNGMVLTFAGERNFQFTARHMY